MTTRARRGSRATDRSALGALATRLCERKAGVRLVGLRGGTRSAVAAELVRAQGTRPLLFLAATSKAGDSLLADLRTLLGDEAEPRLRAFPRPDSGPYDRFSPQPFVVVQRAAALHLWLDRRYQKTSTEAAPVVVAPFTALLPKVPSRNVLRRHTSQLEVGKSIDRDGLLRELVQAGYSRQPLVEERGEVAVRGGIVDLFPPQSAHPVRIELLGDEVESIREYEAATQRSRRKLERVSAPPPRELLFRRDEILERSDDIRERALEQELPDRCADDLLDALLRGFVPPGSEALAPLVQGEQESVFDYLPDDLLIAIDDPAAGRERLDAAVAETEPEYALACAAGRLALPLSELWLSGEQIDQELAARHALTLERLDVEDAEDERAVERLPSRGHEELRHALARTRSHERALEPLADQLLEWSADEGRVVLTCSALSGAERLRHLLAEYGLETRVAQDGRPLWRWSAPGRIEVRVAELSQGFELTEDRLAVVTEEEIFGPRERRRRRTSLREGAALEGIAQLAPGDTVVHDEHGIGIYRGLVELEAGILRNIKSEMLCIEYLGGDRFFLAVHRLNHLQRYAGADDASPRLDRMGGQTWEKARRGVKRSLVNMAKELLAVHAARELAPGFAFAPRDTYFEEFESAFPFEETPDQHAAIEEVLADMQRAKPMDRIVCGDVGYGKTEVAIRGAFRAVMDGKQVAVLVPTTVLCQQHLETFRKRFEGYPVKVESLSRFCSPSESRRILEELRGGAVDIVVGTHRLLGKQVEAKSLGLLVVDEEHRFGVTHKEKIKQWKKSVDVLTLTATPIPRTLQMAFTGIRDLSVIDTAPADRLAVRTQISRYSEPLIREAILREVQRGGQVFFVHNRVQSIAQVAEMLTRLVPEVTVLVAHGQMRERDLEDRMLKFLHGEVDVLLCTTIIESGLDIPRANTMIINRAHTLGLAQLYQLRGRVGRSHHRAYAYLLVPEPGGLTPDAERRLDAIQDLSELGSGFRLASMDLEIRGAGDLLGREQSGNLAAVGYETYMQMLEETVEELRGQIREVEIDPEVRLPAPARLPEEYVPEVGQRLVLYKRLAGAREEGEVDRVRDELLDRFGPLPAESENLLQVIRIKILARQLGVAAVDASAKGLQLSVSGTGRIDPQRLVALAGDPRSGVRMSPDHKILSPAPAEGGVAFYDAALALLTQLGPPIPAA